MKNLFFPTVLIFGLTACSGNVSVTGVTLNDISVLKLLVGVIMVFLCGVWGNKRSIGLSWCWGLDKIRSLLLTMSE